MLADTAGEAAPAVPNDPKAPTQRLQGDHFVKCLEADYDALLAAKIAKFQALLSTVGTSPALPPIEVFESPKSHFRMRANFNIWRDTPKSDDFFYAMFEPEAAKRQAAEITSFPRGTIFLNELMATLMTILKMPEYRILGSTLFEVRFVCTQTEQAVIVLLYRSAISAEWRDKALGALQLLPAGKVIKIVGRSHKVKEVITRESQAGGTSTGASAQSDIIEEIYTVQPKTLGRKISLFQTEGAFSQPNASVCEKMLTWVCDITAPACPSNGEENNKEFLARDLLELYCGGGTFTAALCVNFRQVLATEVSKASVELADMCFSKNKIENVKAVRMSSEEFEVAMTGGRANGESFRRLEIKQVDLKKYDFSTVLVDPPRSGLDEKTCRLLCRFDHILYISCNPETLTRDLKVIMGTGDYTIERLAAFDQFPYTHHLEGGVYLKKKRMVMTTLDKESAAEGDTLGKRKLRDGDEKEE